MSDPTPKPEECHSCGFETSELTEFPSQRIDRKESNKWLCALCASTFAGNALDYPEFYKGESNTLKAICYVGNVILQEIRRIPANGAASAGDTSRDAKE